MKDSKNKQTLFAFFLFILDKRFFYDIIIIVVVGSIAQLVEQTAVNR